MKKRFWQAHVLIMAFVFYLAMTPVAMAAQGTDKANGNGKVQTQQLQSINQKLEHIDTRLGTVVVGIDNYFASNDVSEEETGDTAGQDENTEEQPVNQEDGTALIDDADPTEDTAVQDELVDEQAPANIEDSEEEESISGYSLIGKLNSLNNQISSSEKRLQKLTGIDPTSEEYINITQRLEQLRENISQQLSRLDILESPVREKMQQSLNEQEQFPVASNIVNANKVWKIKFNRNLNENSMSKFNIFVVDANDNLVEVNVSYDSSEGAVLIEAVEPYRVGEQYTLFISKDVKAQSGDALKNAVKVQFTVE